MRTKSLRRSEVILNRDIDYLIYYCAVCADPISDADKAYFIGIIAYHKKCSPLSALVPPNPEFAGGRQAVRHNELLGDSEIGEKP